VADHSHHWGKLTIYLLIALAGAYFAGVGFDTGAPSAVIIGGAAILGAAVGMWTAWAGHLPFTRGEDAASRGAEGHRRAR
jgi:hypothetical protein